MLAFRRHYGAQFGMVPDSPKVVFLGVTYPITSHLIDSLFSRYEPREVSGIAYGADGLRSIAGLIHNWLAPCNHLKYVYFPEYAQDTDAAEQLKRTRLFGEQILSIQQSSPAALAQDLQDPDTVYFSWYTFESIFESHEPTLDELSGKLKERSVVATTRHNCEHRCAFAAVSADDLEIGRQGAEIIHDRHTGRIEHLGRHDIVIPRIRYWLNRTVMAQQGIQLPDLVMAGAERVYD